MLNEVAGKLDFTPLITRLQITNVHSRPGYHDGARFNSSSEENFASGVFPRADQGWVPIVRRQFFRVS